MERYCKNMLTISERVERAKKGFAYFSDPKVPASEKLLWKNEYEAEINHIAVIQNKFYSDVVSEKFWFLDDYSIEFESGVRYTLGEQKYLIDTPKDVIVKIHEVMKLFDGSKIETTQQGEMFK